MGMSNIIGLIKSRVKNGWLFLCIVFLFYGNTGLSVAISPLSPHFTGDEKEPDTFATKAVCSRMEDKNFCLIHHVN
jgi:hypothetical protein